VEENKAACFTCDIIVIVIYLAFHKIHTGIETVKEKKKTHA
jgi:hypothetical protein